MNRTRILGIILKLKIYNFDYKLVMTSLDMKLQNFKHPINTWRQYYGCRQTEKPYSNRQNAYEILELYQHYILNDGTIMNTGGSPYLSVKYIIAAINLYLLI